MTGARAHTRSGLDKAIELLTADLADITDQTLEPVRRLPSYQTVPEADLVASIRRNLDAAIRTLQADVAPTTDDMALIAETAVRQRVAQGVPVEDMMRSYRISIGVIHDHFVDRAEQCNVAAKQMLRCARLLWATSDAFTTQVALEYQRSSVEVALRDAHARGAFLESLLSGGLGPNELAQHCALYGLDLDAPYYVVRARVTDDRDLAAMCRTLESLGGTSSRRALLTVIQGDCVGIVARRPRALDGVVMGIGEARPLTDLSSAAITASRVLHAAVRLGRTGVVSLDDLSWRLAAVEDAQVSTLLSQRYLAPLRAHGEFGLQLEHTMRAYLEHGFAPGRTAEALIVHINTLRYRLRKFEELTGASLSSTDVIVELAWALQCPPPADDPQGYAPSTVMTATDSSPA
jgi:hypothetical protein